MRDLLIRRHIQSFKCCRLRVSKSWDLECSLKCWVDRGQWQNGKRTPSRTGVTWIVSLDAMLSTMLLGYEIFHFASECYIDLVCFVHMNMDLLKSIYGNGQFSAVMLHSNFTTLFSVRLFWESIGSIFRPRSLSWLLQKVQKLEWTLALPQDKQICIRI
jgi:hypothetical protein